MGVAPTRLSAMLLNTSEYHGDVVKATYQRYLARSPDSAGLAYWTTLLDGGTPDEALAVMIAASDEFYALAQSTAS